MRTISGFQVPETVQEAFHPERTALVIVDVQNDFCSTGGHAHRYGDDLSMIQAMIPRLQRLLGAARDAGILTVFVQQTTLPNGLSDSPAWLFFKNRDGQDPEYTLRGSWGHRFVDGITSLPHEPVIPKHRTSGFVRTTLDLTLRARGVDALLFTGVATEGCVEATLRDATYHDFYVALVEDCVASTHHTLHESALTLMRQRHPVVRAGDVIDWWIAAGRLKTAPVGF